MNWGQMWAALVAAAGAGDERFPGCDADAHPSFEAVVLQVRQFGVQAGLHDLLHRIVDLQRCLRSVRVLRAADEDCHDAVAVVAADSPSRRLVIVELSEEKL
ncbi:hypothetical protein [Streptomyces sp. NPDC008121]|uniref:hypothetical protein n=1 Tax=Streptomyces sp. NPDC008121 TaxID=3364809 RepID=UPI0036E6C9D4